jgi:hypothetical protein
MDDPKGLERTSPARTPESTQSWTLSSDERTLFDDLFGALDSLVLERCAEGPAFRPIHEVPTWAHCVITRVPDQPSQDLWVPTSYFLEDRMPDAHQWWDKQEGGESSLGRWEADGLSEARLDLEAAATAIGPRKLLVIKKCAPSIRAYIQRMRGKRVDLHQRPLQS